MVRGHQGAVQHFIITLLRANSRMGLLVCLLLAISPSFSTLKAQTPSCPTTLAWNYSPDPTVTGYAIYYSAAGSWETNRYDVGMTNEATMFCLLADSNYVFYVVSYDAYGDESAPSNFVTYGPPALSSLTITPTVDGTLSLQFSAAPGTPCHIEYTSTLNPTQWQVLGNATADQNGNITLSDIISASIPARFYRAATP